MDDADCSAGKPGVGVWLVIPGHPALTSPDPSPQRPQRSDGLLVALAAVVGAVVVLAGLVGFQQLRDPADGDETAAVDLGRSDAESDPTTSSPDPSTSPSPSPSTSPSTSLAPVVPVDPEEDATDEGGRPPVDSVACPARFDAVICEAADFVQQTRGRPFKRFPNIELLSDADFDVALVEDLDDAEQDLRADELVLKSLALIPSDLDLFAAFQTLIQSGVVGFYDPDTGRLAVRGGEFDLYGQAILVHELVHAYDDQWFDLGRDEFEDDAEYGFVAVIEGNANRVETLWRSQLSPADQELLQQLEFGALSPEDLDRLLSLPQVILNLQASPYQDGETYVSGVARSGGEAAVDERLITPPESSEQVLHPDAPAADLALKALDPPAADGAELGRGTVGELLMGMWLGPRAAAGWGGDRYVITESGSRICITLDMTADTEADLGEMADAVGRWAAQRPDDRTLELVEPSVVRATGCY